MAEKQMKTTSSSTLDGNNERKINRAQPVATPSAGSADCSGHRNVQILTRLANNLSESYQLVKQRQQKYNELNAKLTSGAPRLIGYRKTHSVGEEPAADSGGGGGDWQEVTNKLKRKKKLSTSLTSVDDTVNQEKRTRIEGIQLNCRGKLQISEVPLTATRSSSSALQQLKTERSAARPPPVPPSPTPSARQVQTTAVTNPTPAHTPIPTSTSTTTPTPTVPPPRLKRKLQENVQTIQKLNALTEQLRLEINELKSSLTTERGAVRVLRAQNESETRKWRNEVKKLQNTVELMKKSQQNQTLQSSSVKKPLDSGLENSQTNAMAGSLANCEIQRLTSEIIALKEANKILEEKKVLEEIKTKERNIGQLKKELQIHQTKPQQPETKQSRNATTNQTKNKTTKPKKNSTKNTTIKINEKPKVPAEDVEKMQKADNKEQLRQVQDPNEVKKLKDIELINNTKNIQNNLKTTTTTTTTTIHTTTTATKILNNINSQNLKLLKPLENVRIHHENHENIIQNSQSHEQNCNNLLKTANVTTTTSAYRPPNNREYHSLPHELSEEHLIGRETAIMGTAAKTETNQQQQQRNEANEYRSKDNNSDSDSALSSAPPSISPQPPPAGLDTADIWQMIRTYSTDLEKLQKDNEILQKENEHLHSDLNSAKEQILESEKAAMEANNNAKLQQLIERLKQLEEQEHQLRNEADELREQNELLEFRILELEETNDKWSLQSHATPSSASTTSNTATVATAKDVWACGKSSRGIEDPMQLLFGSNSLNTDSGITSPHSQQHMDDELHLVDPTNEELRRRIGHMVRKGSLDEEDKQCLQQVLQLVQQLDLLSQRSGPNSLNTTSCSSDDASSLDFAKSRISDYSSASSPSSARSAHENVHHSTKSSSSTKSIVAPPPAQASSSTRIVATVPPYNSCPQQPSTPQQQHASHQPVPSNTPSDSPRKSRPTWQSNSLSESGVFVESDFLSDVSEHNAYTQTDFEDENENSAVAAKDFCGELQRFQRYDVTGKAVHRVPAYSPHAAQLSPNLGDQKRLEYYKERLTLLENKVLIYESSGDLQTKRLADRLQREIQLEKQLKELRDRVEFLESESAALEEEKCEFEEAENDTRLRLQRLEVELEILSQRNVELEMSREALSAKYKDCRSECLILREDLSASETQIRHLEEDKQKAKENLELLHSLLPLLLIYNTTLAVAHLHKEPKEQKKTTPLLALPTLTSAPESTGKMGNTIPVFGDQITNMNSLFAGSNFDRATPNLDCDEAAYGGQRASGQSNKNCVCTSLKEEVKCLKHQLRELNSRHYEAMESADSHWVDLERGYKNREEAFRAKECCLKAKIQKLQDCLRDDARAANEKILQLEEAERELKCCLVRVSKEHRDIVEEHQSMIAEYEKFKEQYDKLKEVQKPLLEAADKEKKRCKAAADELSFLRKLQAETESHAQAEAEAMRAQMFDLRKDFLHIEVTNSELKEEVATLEQTIHRLEVNEKEYMDKIRVLQDEVRSKEEMVQKLEKRLERSEGYSLAQELNGSPSKRFKREDVKDLKSANTGLAAALRNFKECEDTLPSHQQFSNVARNVKRLADTLLFGEEEVSEKSSPTQPPEAATPTASAPEMTTNEATNEATNEPTEPTDGLDTEIKQEPLSSDPAQSEDGNEMTVGMVLMPQFQLDQSLMPSCSYSGMKKQIYEVPSELRKLSASPTVTDAATATTMEWSMQSMPSVCQRKYPPGRGIYKRRHRRKSRVLRERMRRIVSCMTTRRSQRFHDVYDVDTCQSEILRSHISFASFYSVREDVVEPQSKVDAFTETEKCTSDAGTETAVCITENGVQVDDEMNPERLLDAVPSQTRGFLNMLKSSVAHTDFDAAAFNKSLMKRWEADRDFRDGLELLRSFAAMDPDGAQTVSVENYEHFVNSMSCLHVLEELFKPIRVPIVQQIEDQINEELMSFHSRRMESEFYCTVYYPVKRQVLVESSDLLIK